MDVLLLIGSIYKGLVAAGYLNRALWIEREEVRKNQPEPIDRMY